MTGSNKIMRTMEQRSIIRSLRSLVGASPSALRTRKLLRLEPLRLAAAIRLGQKCNYSAAPPPSSWRRRGSHLAARDSTVDDTHTQRANFPSVRRAAPRRRQLSVARRGAHTTRQINRHANERVHALARARFSLSLSPFVTIGH